MQKDSMLKVCLNFQFRHWKVSFFTGRVPENWGDQVLFLRSKGGIKRFFKLKRGSLTFFKEIKYFVKHFRFQRKELSDVTRG